ncbi:hypothetical protein L1887_49088 [Cichorium endivia]|nr:hypothetical protein L1887_49088 [Cichorium endivia]
MHRCEALPTDEAYRGVHMVPSPQQWLSPQDLRGVASQPETVAFEGSSNEKSHALAHHISEFPLDLDPYLSRSGHEALLDGQQEAHWRSHGFGAGAVHGCARRTRFCAAWRGPDAARPASSSEPDGDQLPHGADGLVQHDDVHRPDPSGRCLFASFSVQSDSQPRPSRVCHPHGHLPTPDRRWVLLRYPAAAGAGSAAAAGAAAVGGRGVPSLYRRAGHGHAVPTQRVDVHGPAHPRTRRWTLAAPRHAAGVL